MPKERETFVLNVNYIGYHGGYYGVSGGPKKLNNQYPVGKLDKLLKKIGRYKGDITGITFSERVNQPAIDKIMNAAGLK